MRIILELLLISVIIGIGLMYVYAPKPEIIIKLPNENNVFIDINNVHISKLFDSSTILNFLYGCSCPKLKPIDTLFWCPFSMIDETINKELGIISHVIEKSF